ncbi:MAG: elongation factor Ts [Acidimicrobiia bacterium]|nr:elongation factor Ts [Acidimicrobiia bacterium]
MADIAAKDVAQLRKLTGAGMMDCKKALVETSGDIEAAKDWLRKKGLAGAAKREGRAADQGAIEVVVEGGVAAVVELNCETDFVAKGAEFKDFVGALANQVARDGDADLAGQAYDGSTVGETITQMGSRLGERIELGRIARYESADGILDGYKHIQNDRGTIGVLVELAGVSPDDANAQSVAHDIALHIASAAPRFVSKDDVPADAIEKEREVLTELTRNEGKPDDVIEKIVTGRLNGFYKDYCLLEQGFVKEPKTTIAKLVDGLGSGATVKRFVRIKVGED